MGWEIPSATILVSDCIRFGSFNFVAISGIRLTCADGGGDRYARSYMGITSVEYCGSSMSLT